MSQYLLVTFCRAVKYAATAQQAMRVLGRAETCLRPYTSAATPVTRRLVVNMSNSRYYEVKSARGNWKSYSESIKSSRRPPAVWCLLPTAPLTPQLLL